MICFHCGGRHDPDFCPGYGFYSLRQRAEGIHGGIERLSGLGGESLARLSGLSSSLDALGGTLSRSVGDAGEAVSGSIGAAREDIVEAIDSAAVEVSEAVIEGSERTVRAIDRGTLVNAIGFAGVAAVTARAAKSVCMEIEATRARIDAGFHGVLEGIVGIGAALEYRERMDELRHEAETALHEEASVAGRARRSICAAAALLDVDPEEALTHARRAVKQFPTAGEAYRMRGTVQSVLNRHADAVKSFQVALTFSKDGKVAPLLRGENPSKGSIRKAAVSSSVQLAHALLVTNKADQAIDAIESQLRSWPAEPDLLFAMLRVLSHDGRWTAKHADYVAKLVRASPRHFNVLHVAPQFSRERKRDIVAALQAVRDRRIADLAQKMSALDMMSRGNSPWLRDKTSVLDDARLPFLQVTRLIDEVSSEMLLWSSGNA